MAKEKDIIMKLAYRKLVLVQITSSLTSFIGPLINGIVISSFLGAECMAAFGIVSPVNICIWAIATIFNAGAQNIAGGYLGKGLTNSVNQLMTNVVVCLGVLSLALSFGIFFAAGPISTILGATSENLDLCVSYIRGYAFGVLPIAMMPTLFGFLQIDNSGRLVVVSTAVMTVTYIILDLMTVFVFQNGLFGTGLAISISSFVELIPVLLHFCGKKSMLKFRIKGSVLKDIRKVLVCGLPAAVLLICDCLRVSVTNKIILSVADTSAVAALSILTTVRPFALSVTLGVGITTLLVCSVILGEQNRHTLRKELEYIFKFGIGIACIFTVIVLAIARYPLALMFCAGESGQFTDMVVTVIRLSVISIPFCMINTIFMYYYECAKKVTFSLVLCIMDNAVFVILAAKLLSGVLGLTGIWLGSLAAELLSILMIVVVAAIKNHRIPRSIHDFLFLPASFGVPAEDRINITASSHGEAVGISERIIQFCEAHGMDSRRAMASGLCMEELSVIAIDRGPKSGRAHVDVYVTYQDGKSTVRLIDNCKPFNELLLSGAYDEKDPCANVGVRIVKRFARDMNYSTVFGMNVFTLEI